MQAANWKTGGAELKNWRCSSGSCSNATNGRMKVLSIESGSPYPDYSNKSTFLWVQAILKAQEACKVKLSCFKGIVHPTHFQKQVGWGTWLVPTPPRKADSSLTMFSFQLAFSDHHLGVSADWRDPSQSVWRPLPHRSLYVGRETSFSQVQCKRLQNWPED